MQSFLTDFIDCVNAFQRHPQCTQKYCKRVRKGKVICRFGFPIKLKNISKFECLYDDDNNLIDVKFLPAINDRWMNKHIPEHLLTWRANTDASMITSAVAILF